MAAAAATATMAAGAARLLPAALAALAAALPGALAGDLVGPDAVGSYQGRAHGRKFGGFVRVQDPSVGFFVAGSTVQEMNGLYGRVTRVPTTLQHEFHLAYKHDYTGWFMALTAAPDDVVRTTGKQTQWLLIDNDGVDRFRCEGDTLIPPAGKAWSHVHRAAAAEPNPDAGTAVAAAAPGDDEEELPWQVIGVGGEEMMYNLRQYFRFYRHTVQKAISGQDLPPLPSGSPEQAPPDDFRAPAVLDASSARELCEPDSRAAVDEALRATIEQRDRWGQALLHLRVGACHRLRREFQEARGSVASALAIFPRYKDALLERGAALMDEGVYEEAVTAFETLLRIDRAWPSIDRWLVRAHAHKRRGEEARGSNLGHETAHCVAWRQTGYCSAAGPREPRSDLACDMWVDPTFSGFCECKGPPGVHATAAESGCEHDTFTCADKCREKWASRFGSQPPATAGGEPLPAGDAGAEPCSGAGGAPPSWCSANHYFALGVRCDLPEAGDGADGGDSDDLKRAYKRRSLQLHPDKMGGSVQAFQRIAAAHEVLSDPEKRRAFDEGAELPREEQKDGTEGPSHREQIEKKYFPERFGFEPFGDPHADRKERADRERRRLEQRRQDMLARRGSEL